MILRRFALSLSLLPILNKHVYVRGFLNFEGKVFRLVVGPQVILCYRLMSFTGTTEYYLVASGIRYQYFLKVS